MKKIIAVTGADGFIGAAVCGRLEGAGHEVVRIVRRRQGEGVNRRVVEDLAKADLVPVLEGSNVVLHLAGRAHVLVETLEDPAKAFERENVLVTARVAEAAVRAKVKRLVFVSSIGVNGSQTYGSPFRESDVPAPVEPYAQSKLRAEKVLASVAERSSLECVIVRPPLVYGPGAPGNFARLVRWAARGLPLPSMALNNRRSLIGVQNLCEFLELCCEARSAAGHTFLVAEPELYSTAQIVTALAKALNKPSRVLFAPPALLRLGAMLIGKRQELEKLCCSLEVSSEKARRLLGWKPRVSFDEEMSRVAQWYLGNLGGK